MAGSNLLSFEAAPNTDIHKKIRNGAFMGMITTGYVLGIVGIALTYATEPLGLDSFWLGLIGAGSMFGIFFGSLFFGRIADNIGRKPLYCLLMILMIIVSCSQFFLSDPFFIATARFILGMLVGADYTVGISLLSEWSPMKKRAPMLAWLLIYWTIGYTIAYAVGFFMDSIVEMLGNNGWRLVLCTSAVPALITLFIRIGSPESPRWLVSKNRLDEARSVIKANLGEEYDIPEKEEESSSGSWFALFAPAQWRKTLVGGIFFFAQVLPFFSISIFVPLVLKELNIQNPTASGVLYNASTFIGVFVGAWIYNRIGRRPFLLGTFYIAAILLSIMILWTSVPPILALVLVTAFALVMAMAIVPEFSYPAELFPTELRGSGVGLSVAISRFGAGGGTFLLPIISEQYGMNTALWFCVATLIFGGIICQMWAPETSEKHAKRSS